MQLTRETNPLMDGLISGAFTLGVLPCPESLLWRVWSSWLAGLMLKVLGMSSQDFVHLLAWRNKWLWPFLLKMFFERSQCCQQDPDWWQQMLRSRASTPCHFTWYLIGSNQPDRVGLGNVSSTTYSEHTFLPFSPHFCCFSPLWDIGDCFRSSVLRAKEMGKGRIQSHEIRGQNWGQERKRRGGGPRLWVKTHEPVPLDPPGWASCRHRVRVTQSPAPRWHNPS